MKKIYTFWAMAMICAAVASCSKENYNEVAGGNAGGQTEETIPVNYIELTFCTPGIDVKTSVEGQKVSWSEGDKILICWDGGSVESNAVTFEDGVARFSASVPDSATDFFAVYPSEMEASVAEGKFNVTIPSSQSGRFADADIIVARTTKDQLTYAFRHAVSLVKFVISEGNPRSISRAQFADIANSSQLTGTMSITFDENDAISGTSVTADTALDVIDVTDVQEGDNYMAVLPGKKLSGFGLRLGSSENWYTGIATETDVTLGERLNLNIMDTRINDGDWYIREAACGSGDGTSWENAGDASLLASLLGNSTKNVKNLAYSWRLNGKTIRVAGGTYSSLAVTGFGSAFSSGDVSFTIEGGYNDAGEKDESAVTLFGAEGDKTDNKRAFFFRTGAKATIKDIHFKKHNYEPSSTIYAVATELTVENCTFEDNQSAGNGGAVGLATSGTMSLKNCVFAGNKATAGGGAVYNEGTLILENCLFNGNIAKDGGAVYNAGEDMLKADRCTFIGNKTDGTMETNSSAAVTPSNSMCFFNACVFTGNYTDSKNQQYGLMYSTTRNAKLGFNNCLFYNNSDGRNTLCCVYTSNAMIFANSTALDKSSCGSANAASLVRNGSYASTYINNVIINTGTSAHAIRGNGTSHPAVVKNNIISSARDIAYTDSDKNVTDISALTGGEFITPQDGGMSYYLWSGVLDGFTATDKTDIATAIKDNNVFGNDFYNWLIGLDYGNGKTALDVDIRGVERSSTVWPGSYQN